VRSAGDPGSYDAVVVGSTVHGMHWLKEAADFVQRHAGELAARPAWLFSSGPPGSQATDGKGRDLRKVAEPKEIPGFKDAIALRDHHVFFGALDPGKLSFR
jgi:menaquinone-dependent protoporphyrinogen oxidase